MNDKTKVNPTPFPEWLKRFCEKYNSFANVTPINPKDVEKGYLLHQVYKTNCLFFVEDENLRSKHDTPELAATNFFHHVMAERCKTDAKQS